MTAGTNAVERLDVHAFRFPTDGPDGRESDGTLTWESTTMVLVEAHAAGTVGIGYSYADESVATFVRSRLAPVVVGADPHHVGAAWHRMSAAIRNVGKSGIGAMAMAAVDIALWDLKARLSDVALFRALPTYRDSVAVYGSGGFTNYPVDRLVAQAQSWLDLGIRQVKLKTSRRPDDDPARLSALRESLGGKARLMADANGALNRKSALYWTHRLHDEWGVDWFEEPVSSADLEGLRLVRDHGPPGLDVAAGEYGYVLGDFTDLLNAGAVDCLQIDVTRCGGITAMLEAAAVAAGHHVDVSAHCAPAVSAHACCAARMFRHLEYFHDHVRIERLAFDGVPPVEDGRLRPDPGRAGLGLRVKWDDIEEFRIGTG